MTEHSKDKKQDVDKTRKTYEACPHCGHELSPWQQVLLTIDRALVCKNCWYRIILETPEDDENPLPPKYEE